MIKENFMTTLILTTGKFLKIKNRKNEIKKIKLDNNIIIDDANIKYVELMNIRL